MIVELIIQFSGNRQLLFDVFAHGAGIESIINTYREYHNRFASRIGLNIGSLNSLILGNQIASQLNLYALLWFSPVYYCIKISKIIKNSNLWFVISFILLIISPTMTTNTLLIISIFLLVYYLPVSKINTLLWKIIFPLFSIIFLGFFANLFFPLFFEGDQTVFHQGNKFTYITYYITGMLYPVFVFLDMPIWDQIFGRMAHNVGWAELGYFKLLISTGALWVFPMTIAIIIIISSAFRSSKNINLIFKTNSHNIKQKRKWIWIAQVNALISLMFFLSLIHYITIFRLGAIQLFSLHIAITMFATRKVRTLRDYTTCVSVVDQTIISN